MVKNFIKYFTEIDPNLANKIINPLAAIYPSSFTNVRFCMKIEFSNVIFGTVSFTMGPWWSPSGGSGGKTSKTFYLAYVWRVDRSLEYNKLVYFECKIKTNLLLHTLK